MHFIRTAGWEDGIADFTERLVHNAAAGKRILWLTSGGSNLTAAVSIMETIPQKLSRRLTIMFMDERYGPLGHADSNYAQLLKARFDAGKARLLAPLEAGLSFADTVSRYEALATAEFAAADVIIGQFGIGEDGHTAGILPHSPATRETARLVSGYSAPPLERFTLTFTALRRVDLAFAFAFGAGKQAALHALRFKRLSLEAQPAAILKQIPEVYVYNDQIKGGRR